MRGNRQIESENKVDSFVSVNALEKFQHPIHLMIIQLHDDTQPSNLEAQILSQLILS